MHSKRIEDWLAAARADLPDGQQDLLAEQRLLARVREVMALQSIAAARFNLPARREQRVSSWQRWLTWRSLALAGIAAIAIAIVAVTRSPDTTDLHNTTRAPFLALVASEAIAAEPSAWLVSSQVLGATLADYGLPLDPARVDQPVAAEFLMSHGGIALAVRFIE